MALDPESIGVFIGTVLTSAGATIGGLKVLARRQSSDGSQGQMFCQEHHKCFEEIKDAIGEVKTDVAYIRGAIDRREK